MNERWQELGELYAHERARFLAFARRRLYDLAGLDPEDVLSEVVGELLRRADLVGGVENLTAYIYRALANRIIDHRRRAVPEVEAMEERTFDGDTRPLLPPDPHPLADALLATDELRERLMAAIGELNPLERAVWVATEIDGSAFRELSEEWSEPVGTLLSRKSRATAKLRQKLSDLNEDC